MNQAQQAQTSSKEVLIDTLRNFSNAGIPIVQIRTREPMRAATVLRESYTRADNPYNEWSISTGWRVFTTENYTDHLPAGIEAGDALAAFIRPRDQLRDVNSPVHAAPDKVHYFCFIDPQAHMVNDPMVLDLMQQYASILPATNVALLLITPDMELPLPQGLVMSTTLPMPTAEELREALDVMLENADNGGQSSFEDGINIDDEERDRIALQGLGLAFSEFETHVTLSIIDAHAEGNRELTAADVMDGVSVGKTEVVRQSELLELMQPEDISNVGGMQRLKDWVAQRKSCYTEEAREFGIEPPKGLVLVGVPGTGKSLVAKAVATELGIPLVRLDIGRVFSKFIGESEQRMRAALKMVEDMAPCVLFVDEIDKGLGGAASGGGDSGVSMRVLGSYLTWLQELKRPVFNMVTANRVDGLPPELLRRGRFDQIFSVAMPSQEERREVLSIHLRKRGRDIKDLKAADVMRILAASNDYVPAEIESSVKDALIASFSAGVALEGQHILDALQNLVPMSKSHADAIQRIIHWASNNAIPVNYPAGHGAVLQEVDSAPRARRTSLVRPRSTK